MGQCTLQGGKGYWLISNGNVSFIWDLSNLALGRINSFPVEIPKEYEYNQSTEQAFYFIESIESIIKQTLQAFFKTLFHTEISLVPVA